MSTLRPLAVIILAAGKGTRMKNPDMAKVMYPINGRPMVEHVVDLAIAAGAARVVVIVGWQKESVIAHLRSSGKPVVCVEQVPQLGTGHAVMQARPLFDDFDGDLLVLSGDVPMLSLSSVQSLIARHRSSGARATVLTATLDDPTGYGRILRNADGSVCGIVEQKDATHEQRAVREINSGIYLFDAGDLFAALDRLTPDNAQKEYYLTDVVAAFRRKGLRVDAVGAGDSWEVLGVNTLDQLEEIRRLMGVKAG